MHSRDISFTLPVLFFAGMGDLKLEMQFTAVHSTPREMVL